LKKGIVYQGCQVAAYLAIGVGRGFAEKLFFPHSQVNIPECNLISRFIEGKSTSRTYIAFDDTVISEFRDQPSDYHRIGFHAFGNCLGRNIASFFKMNKDTNMNGRGKLTVTPALSMFR
jgi:hypothetical protein